MSMISEQVNALKDLAESQNIPYHKRIIKRAADTIESLSAELQAENMEHINPNEILKEIREKAQKLSNQHWGDDERHLVGKGIQCMCVQAENIISKYMERTADCGEWIPCKERLPEEYGDYLVAWKPLYMTKDQMVKLFGQVVPHFYEIVEYDPDDDKKWIGDIKQAHGQYEIIAWRHLPEPYHEP